MAAKSYIEDGDDGSGPLDKVASQKRAYSKAGKETSMDIANGHGSPGWWRAVARVRLAENAASGKRSRDAVKDSTDEQPPVVEDLRILCAENGDDLADQPAAGCERHELSSSVAIREFAQLGGDDGAQSADDEVQAQHKGGDISLDFGGVALRVVGAQDDGLVGEMRVDELLVCKVLLANKIKNSAAPSLAKRLSLIGKRKSLVGCCLQVEFRNNQAAKGESEDGIRSKKPEYLRRIVRCCVAMKLVSPHSGQVKHTEGLRHQGKCWKSASLSQLSFLAPNPSGPSNCDVSVTSESRSLSISRIVGLGLRSSLDIRFGPVILCVRCS